MILYHIECFLECSQYFPRGLRNGWFNVSTSCPARLFLVGLQMGRARPDGDFGYSSKIHGRCNCQGQRCGDRHPWKPKGDRNHKPERDNSYLEQKHRKALLQCSCLDGQSHEFDLQVSFLHTLFFACSVTRVFLVTSFLAQ